jgi:hypothetical protein
MWRIPPVWSLTAFPLLRGDLHPSALGVPGECGLTLRSSGPPPARHLAREPASVIIRLAGQAPTRFRPLSSNVRRLGRTHAVEHRASATPLFWLLVPPGASGMNSSHSSQAIQANTGCGGLLGLPVRWRAAHRSWFACGNTLSSSTVRVWESGSLDPRWSSACSAAGSITAIQGLARLSWAGEFASRIWRSPAPLLPEPPAHKQPPNPSLERTHTGMALGPRGVSGHHPPRGPSATPARAAQLKR